MLSAEQVIPFLNHDDEWVRDHALRYFEHHPNPAPFTAEHLWAVLDARGQNRETIHIAQALEAAPWTEAALRRLLVAIEVPDAPDEFRVAYQRAARAVDFELLRAHADELTNHSGIVPHVRDHLRRRLDLAGCDPAAMWDRLMARGAEVADAWTNEFDTSESDALIEALGRHPDVSGPLALATLQRLMTEWEAQEAEDAAREAERDAAGEENVDEWDDEDDDAEDDYRSPTWSEVFAVRVLGECRYEPAVPSLIDAFRIDEDFFPQDLRRALARIGTAEVIERVMAFYPGKEWYVRLYCVDPVGDVKCPESEQALLTLFGREDDPALRALLLIQLCELGCVSALAPAVAEVTGGEQCPELNELEEAVLALSAMTGAAVPQARDWRKRAAKRRRRWRDGETPYERMNADRHRNWLETGMTEPTDRPSPLARLTEGLPLGERSPEYPDRDTFDDYGDTPLSFGAAPGVIPEPVLPIRRTEPKVGRNDPCPCGSGKKYKKCCMGK